MQKMNTQFHLLRIAFKVLLTVSGFSFIFSQYSSLLLCSVDEFSSSFSVNQLFRYSSETNYVFLLCNGILVFVITNSGLIAKPPGSPTENATGNPRIPEEKFQEEEEEEWRTGDDEREISSVYQHHHLKEEEKENWQGGCEKGILCGDEEGEEDETRTGDHERVTSTVNHQEEEDNEEGEEDDGIGKLSDEEWDKKFDDFIKKMKQDIIMSK